MNIKKNEINKEKNRSYEESGLGFWRFLLGIFIVVVFYCFFFCG